MPITEQRSYFISMRWLRDAGREKERTVHFPEKMARELLLAARNEVMAEEVKEEEEKHVEENWRRRGRKCNYKGKLRQEREMQQQQTDRQAGERKLD